MTNVLVIEDDSDLIELIVMELSSHGLVVSAAADGFQALDLFTNCRYDAVVLDVRLPRINGMQLLGYLQASDLNADTPVFIYSGYVTDDIEKKLLLSGVKSVIRKPNDLAVLAGKIMTTCQAAQTFRHYSSAVSDTLRASLVKALVTVFETPPEFSRPFYKRNSFALTDVNSFICLFGRQVYGSLALSCPSGLIHSKVGELFGTGSPDVQSQLVGDYIGELLNQIAGAFKLSLIEQGVIVYVGLPVGLGGGRRTVPHQAASVVMCLPFKIGEADCFLEVCLGQLTAPAHQVENLAFKVFE